MATFTKRDAAKEQLVTAIHLFFSADCPCSVQTLAGAFLGLLQDLPRHQGKDYLLNFEKHIKPEKLAEWRKLMREQSNFLKHADRDPGGSMAMEDTRTQCQLIEGVSAFESLYGKKTYSMIIYQLWFACAFPGFFTGHGWLSLKSDLEKMGMNTNHFTKQEAKLLIDLMEGKDPELDNNG